MLSPDPQDLAVSGQIIQDTFQGPRLIQVSPLRELLRFLDQEYLCRYIRIT